MIYCVYIGESVQSGHSLLILISLTVTAVCSDFPTHHADIGLIVGLSVGLTSAVVLFFGGGTFIACRDDVYWL